MQQPVLDVCVCVYLWEDEKLLSCRAIDLIDTFIDTVLRVLLLLLPRRVL